MSDVVFPFHFSPSSTEKITGKVTFNTVVQNGVVAERSGNVSVGAGNLKIHTYSSSATQQIIYLHPVTISAHLAWLLHLPTSFVGTNVTLPGQLILSGERTALFGTGVLHIFQSTFMQTHLTSFAQQEIAVLPVLREGVKYGITEAISQVFGFTCDEVVVDEHHAPDSSVASYGRRVDISLFKDIDMNDKEHDQIKHVVIGDSTASGIVLIGVLQEVKKRFPQVKSVDIVAPLATLFALSRVATYAPDLDIHAHIFETVLNAQAPDYYWSPHYSQLELHMKPELQQAYQEWWCQDSQGHSIADTACAGYGWSEAFFHPQKFVRMMNDQLMTRHQMTIADIIEKHV